MSSFPMFRSLAVLFLLVLLVEACNTRRTKAACHDGKRLADFAAGPGSTTGPRVAASPVDKTRGSSTSQTGTSHVLSSLGLTAVVLVLLIIITTFYCSWLARARTVTTMARATAPLTTRWSMLLVGQGHTSSNGSSTDTQGRQGSGTGVRASTAAAAMAVATMMAGTVPVATGAVRAPVIVVVGITSRPAVTAIVVASP